MRKRLNEKLVDLENEDDSDEEEESEEEESEEEEVEEVESVVKVAEEKVKTKQRGRPKGSLNVSTLVAKGLVKNTPGVMPLKKRLQHLHDHLKEINVSENCR